MQGFHSADSQTGATDAVVTVVLARRIGPIKKREVSAGRSDRVGVKQVVSSDVILIDGFLDQPHAQGLRVEAMVFACMGGHRRDVMDPK